MSINNYALLKNNFVVNTISIDDQYIDVLESVMHEHAADSYVKYDDDNPAYIGGDIKDGKFRTSKPSDEYIWNDEVWMWVLPEDDIEFLKLPKIPPIDPSVQGLQTP